MLLEMVPSAVNSMPRVRVEPMVRR